MGLSLLSKIHKWQVFSLALVFRLALVVYGLWQDSNFAVKYTDIDYEVLTDGSRYIAQGGSPYDRSTYRYTPLIAWMLLPNIFVSKLWGKFLFLFCDILIGYLLIEILKFLFESRKMILDGKQRDKYATFYAMFWLFNPIAINVSTRGNAESLIGLLVLSSLYLLIVKRSIIFSAIVYGIAIHFKIYPVVYCLALYFFVDSWNNTDHQHPKSLIFKFLNMLFNSKRITFAITTASTVALLTGFFYWIYGWNFLFETYLYHFVRKDNRHNFSPYFYHIYLSGSHEPSTLSTVASTDESSYLLLFALKVVQLIFNGLIDFGPQAALLLTLTYYYSKDITFCVLLQTMTFVAFNKVCTVQYFSWYFCLLPLALPWYRSASRLIDASLPIGWFLGQGLWLWFAYKLEFLAENTFFEIWIAGLVYFTINVIIIMALIWYHSVSENSYHQQKKTITNNDAQLLNSKKND